MTEVARDHGPRDRRFRIEHAQHLAPADIPRFAALDVIAEHAAVPRDRRRALGGTRHRPRTHRRRRTRSARCSTPARTWRSARLVRGAADAARGDLRRGHAPHARRRHSRRVGAGRSGSRSRRRSAPTRRAGPGRRSTSRCEARSPRAAWPTSSSSIATSRPSTHPPYATRVSRRPSSAAASCTSCPEMRLSTSHTRRTFLAMAAALAGTPARLAASGVQRSAPRVVRRLDRLDLLRYHDAAGNVGVVTTPAQWQRRRGEILEGMQAVMGPLPKASVGGAGTTGRRTPPPFEVLDEVDAGSYVRRAIAYAVDAGPRTPAYLLVPKRAARRRRTRKRHPVPASHRRHDRRRRGRRARGTARTAPMRPSSPNGAS